MTMTEAAGGLTLGIDQGTVSKREKRAESHLGVMLKQVGTKDLREILKTRIEGITVRDLGTGGMIGKKIYGTIQEKLSIVPRKGHRIDRKNLS